MSATWLQAAAWPCPVADVYPRMALPHYGPGGGYTALPLTNGIDNVTCEDKDGSKVCMCVCLSVDQIHQTARPAFAQTSGVTEDDHQPD